MKKILPALLLLFTCYLSNAQQMPCADSLHRQFDFWLGEWEAFNLKGVKAGDSKVSRMLDSCVILEEWTSASIQKGLRYAGKSFNTYNAVTGRWQQFWVDNAGGVTAYFDGTFGGDKMILATGDTRQPDGTNKIQKMTFFNLSPDKVRQFGQSSVDGGKTWTTDFDLEYRRKK